jgi:hypothetical protein
MELFTKFVNKALYDRSIASYLMETTFMKYLIIGIEIILGVIPEFKIEKYIPKVVPTCSLDENDGRSLAGSSGLCYSPA